MVSKTIIEKKNETFQIKLSLLNLLQSDRLSYEDLIISYI